MAWPLLLLFFAVFRRKCQFLGRNAVSPICSPPNKFAARNASSSAAPYEGWSVEIHPVRSTERDPDAKSDSNRGANRGLLIVLCLASWLPYRPGFRQEKFRAQRQRQRPLIDAGNLPTEELVDGPRAGHGGCHRRPLRKQSGFPSHGPKAIPGLHLRNRQELSGIRWAEAPGVRGVPIFQDCGDVKVVFRLDALKKALQLCSQQVFW